MKKQKDKKYKDKKYRDKKRKTEKWTDIILNIFWPRTCPFCGKVNYEGICEPCRKKVDKLQIQEPRCLKCGKPVRYQEQEFCHDCSKMEHCYDRGLSMWLHKPPVNHAIYQLKYHNQRYYARYFAQEICRTYEKEVRLWRPQALVPVPLHRRRRRRRGFNQAELLANEIGKIWGIPVIPDLVKRVHYTGYQKKLDPWGRKKNLEHAFAPGADPAALPADFRRIMIIDDIYTTGNTVDQVAKILKSMGIQKVYFLTISIGQGY